jgi:hypothetical protein
MANPHKQRKPSLFTTELFSWCRKGYTYILDMSFIFTVFLKKKERTNLQLSDLTIIN